MLQEKIINDMKTYLKSGDKEKRDILRLLVSEFQRKQNPHDPITDKEVINIINALIKAEKDLLKYKNESTSIFITLLEQYLPDMLSDEEIKNILNKDYSDIISLDKNQRIKHMKVIMSELGNNVDGSKLKNILMEM